MWIEPGLDLFGGFYRVANQEVKENAILAPFWMNETKKEGKCITPKMI